MVYEGYTCGVKRCRFHVADGYLEVSDCGSYMWDIHCGNILLPAMRDIYEYYLLMSDIRGFH